MSASKNVGYVISGILIFFGVIWLCSAFAPETGSPVERLVVGVILVGIGLAIIVIIKVAIRLPTPLIEELNDSDPLVRMAAVKKLSQSNDPRVLDVLVKVYENKDEMGGIREAARDAIWQIDPKWLPNIPGVEIVEECVSQLISLYDQTPRGEGFIAHSDSAKSVEQIGERLNQAGGFDLMVLAHGRFRQQRPRAARNLEFVWDGVGSWLG